MADVYHPTLYVLFPKASGFPEALRCGRKTRTTRNWKTATAYRYLRWLRAECRGETHWFAARTNWSSASQFGWVTITAWSRQKPKDITPFEIEREGLKGGASRQIRQYFSSFDDIDTTCWVFDIAYRGMYT